LIDSIAFVVQMTAWISRSNCGNGTNSAQSFSQRLMMAGYFFSHFAALAFYVQWYASQSIESRRLSALPMVCVATPALGHSARRKPATSIEYDSWENRDVIYCTLFGSPGKE
jgi:hypothetical protein